MQFSLLVDTFEQMEMTTSRLSLTEHLVSLLKKTPADIIEKVVYLIQGKLRPDYEGIELGLAEKMILRSLAQSSGMGVSALLEIYRKTGDLGDSAKEVMLHKDQTSLVPQQMTVERVYSVLYKIARTTGPRSQELKIRLVSSLLNESTPRESRYIIKFIIGSLRLGIADNTVMDALSLAFTGNKANRAVLENAYNVSSDLGTVARILGLEGIEAVKKLRIVLYKPVRPMLAERVPTVEDVFDQIEGSAAAEYKLDGERIQVHKGSERVELFSRRLENITHHFPDIANIIARSKLKDAIFEGEVVAIDAETSQFLPFQVLMHRRRKHGVEEAMKNYPVFLNVFDILYYDRASKTHLPYSDRRKLIEYLIQEIKDHRILLVPQTVVKDTISLSRFMTKAIENGCEGVMIKQLNSEYRAGARGYAWIKLKREYRNDLTDTLDLVIVGALYGRGRRVGKYGALLLAAYDPKTDTFKTVSKVGTGFTDQDLADFYNSLEKHLIKQRHPRVDAGMHMDVWFEPKIVIEIIASEITLSPIHTAGMDAVRDKYGLALRFPKFTGKIRDDKNAEDATKVEEIISLYTQQKRTIQQ
ncbi:MAG: ATP-dependent DNA ligase [Nitrososphaeraceae archaeon]